LILILMCCFLLATDGGSANPIVSQAPWSKLLQKANAAEDSGDFKAAEQYYLQAVGAAADGGDPVGHFVVAGELGQFYWKRDNGPAAVTYLRMAVTVVRRISPADSQQKGAALSNLGVVLSDTGSLNEGEESLLEALRVFQNLDSHESVATTYDSLALVEMYRGKYTVAEEYSKKSLAILKEHGLENLATARSLLTLARIYAAVGRTPEAERILAQSQALFRGSPSSVKADIIQYRDTKASLLFAQGRVSEAERLWKSAIESARTADPPLIILDLPYHLAELYVQTKQYSKAGELLEQLLYPQAYGSLNALTRAQVEGKLAFVLMQQHQDQRAEALFQGALSTMVASPANESLAYAFICLRYARLKAQHKDWHEAALYVERGVKIESAVIPRSSAMAEALELSAQIYGKLRRRDDAKDCLSRAKAMRAVIESPPPSSTVDVGALAAEMR
jgi:tetratricopeptide (TPR) repeat protein